MRTVASRLATALRPQPWAAGLSLLLLALSLGGIYSLSNFSSATRWVKHTDEVRVGLGHLLSTLSDGETAARGYAMTGDPAFLEPYERARSGWPAEFDRVRTLTGDNPDQQQRLAHLAELVGQRLALLEELRSARDAGRRGAELARLLEGKRTMDDVRDLVTTMDADEERLSALRQDEALRRWRLTMVLLVVGALAFLFVVGAIWVKAKQADEHRRLAEEVVRASNLFGIVLQGVDSGITVQDETGRLVYANRAAARMIGYASPDALVAAPMAEVLNRFEAFHFDGTPFPQDQLPGRAALEGKATEELAIRFRVRGTRDDRWSIVRAVPARDSSGCVRYAINFFREVTDEIREKHQRTFLLRAADELNSSIDYEKTLATVARLAVPVLADWCAIDLADGARIKRVAIAHADPEKVALVAALERDHPADPDAPGGVAEVLRTGKPVFVPEIPRERILAAAVDAEHLRQIDQLQLNSYIGVPLTVRGKTVGALTIAMAESERHHTHRDLELALALADRAALAIDNARLFRETDQARAVATIQRDRTEERFRLLVEGVKDYAIFMLDPTGIVTTWNTGAQLINGYQPHEIIGQHFSVFYSEEAKAAGWERELEIATRLGRFEEEGWRVRKDGSRFWASVVLTAITDPHGRLLGFAKVTRDLTERKRSADALAAEAERRRQAESESQVAQMFMGILGHDLRNPLNAISVAAHLMKRRASGGDTKTIDLIVSSAGRMSNMVAQLLDLTRSRLAGGIPIEKKETELGTIISGVVDELRLAHPSREIAWDAGQVYCPVDHERLAQVVSNLVGNALEHGDPAGRVTVRLSHRGSAAIIQVHSVGPPIPADLLPVIFEPYRRKSGKAKRSRGLGLGLFIAHQIVLGHGGRIDVRSSEDEGTMFTVILPRASAFDYAPTSNRSELNERS